MNITTPNKYKEKIVSKLQGLVWKLENTGDGDFTKNGELCFAKNIGAEFQHTDFVFFDIGANIGEYTDMILDALPSKNYHVHMFEPQQTCFDTLSAKFAKDSSIHRNHFGLSDTNTEATLYKDHDQSGLASVHKRNLAHHNIEMNQSEQITLQTASDYITQHSIKHIHLLKIDIEGHELTALSGFRDFLTPENIDYLQFEYGGANLDSHTSLLDFFTFFEERGFVLCKMMKNGLQQQTYKTRFENFMYQNWVAVNPTLLK